MWTTFRNGRTWPPLWTGWPTTLMPTTFPSTTSGDADCDYTQLLPHDHWQDICRRTGTPPGTGRRERIVRCQLFQRISGLPAEAAPGHKAS